MKTDINKLCVTCYCWNGDKETALKQHKENPLALDLYRGWGEDAECNYNRVLYDIEVFGDADVTVMFNAGFGCIFHHTKGSINE